LSLKQRNNETLQSYLIRFNVAIVASQKPKPSIVLIMGVSKVANKTYFKKALGRYLPMDEKTSIIMLRDICIKKTLMMRMVKSV